MPTHRSAAYRPSKCSGSTSLKFWATAQNLEAIRPRRLFKNDKTYSGAFSPEPHARSYVSIRVMPQALHCGVITPV